MRTFISETLQTLSTTYSDFKNVTMIFPSQRAAVFSKNELKKTLDKGFLPELLTIEDLISRLSGIQKEDTIPLLFELYTCYLTIEKDPVDFHHFSSWAFTVLQDFNEIDQYLVKPEAIFTYLRDVQRLRKWSVEGTFKETPLMKDHYAFMETLHSLYTAFYTSLKQQQKGYQGLLYREAVATCDAFLEQHQNTTFVFIGFNALNAAEEHLFQAFLSTGRTHVFWDIDQAFYNSNHIAGKFIRKYASSWPYYQKNEIQTLSNTFSEPKKIQVVGAPNNVTQLKYAGELLSTFHQEQTAFVLGDESLLTAALHSLPQERLPINITMGYPLKEMPSSQFVLQIFQLHIRQKKLHKERDTYYYKDVLKLLKSESIQRYISQKDPTLIQHLSSFIVQENLMFVSFDQLEEQWKTGSAPSTTLMKLLFQPVASTDDFLQKVLDCMALLQPSANLMEREQLYRIYTLCLQLKEVQAAHTYLDELSTLRNFFNQMIRSEKLSFKGEPLEGLQIMGMLETRGLDFENLIITSVNEGVMPGSSHSNSFIPFDAKVAFGLPTYQERDAIYAYHFFRLLQRAKQCYLIYNTDIADLGSSEKSRFLTQLSLQRSDIESFQVSPKTPNDVELPIRIPKNEAIIKILRDHATKGFSPTAIGLYLRDPIHFYKKYVLGIQDVDTLEETVDYSTFGLVIHDTLDALYQDFVGKPVTVADLQNMQSKVTSLVETYFKKHFKSGDIQRGKNKLIFEVVKKYIELFLEQEAIYVRHHTLEILAVEQSLSATIEVPGIDFPITFKGKVDRVDRVDGNTLRIIDYKTGTVEKKDLKIPDEASLHNMQYAKAIQLLLYAYLYIDANSVPENTQVISGIFALKKSSLGLLHLEFLDKDAPSPNSITPTRIAKFIRSLGPIFTELFDLSTDFIAPE